jgi:hypothetical protein
MPFSLSRLSPFIPCFILSLFCFIACFFLSLPYVFGGPLFLIRWRKRNLSTQDVHKPLLLRDADLRNTGLRLRRTRKLPAAPRTASTRNYKATSWHDVICPHSGDSHPKQDGGVYQQ